MAVVAASSVRELTTRALHAALVAKALESDGTKPPRRSDRRVLYAWSIASISTHYTTFDRRDGRERATRFVCARTYPWRVSIHDREVECDVTIGTTTRTSLQRRPSRRSVRAASVQLCASIALARRALFALIAGVVYHANRCPTG